RAAQQHHPGHFTLNYSLAYSLLISFLGKNTQGPWAEVTGFYRAALAVRPRSTNALYGLGLSLARQEKLDDAILAFRKVISVKPDHSAAYYSLSLTLERKGDFAEASAARRRWRGLLPDPDNPDVRVEMARSLFRWAKGLVANPDPRLRDPVRAVDLAKEA